jgi:hypothetical protein
VIGGDGARKRRSEAAMNAGDDAMERPVALFFVRCRVVAVL